ncbi:flagellar hook-length control protein FliK [Georgenia satyanarayanai]|uniref:flagellar hook-length control protein FliK n=1 Tax=Georgenia satyanarayanai TaxID=860221 RepID=UPI0012641075|nr:flagellar hook-length control protein FliK [Georgenia satyanarayanai]
MSIVIPAAPAPATPAGGRPAAGRAGSGDAFAASLAAATLPADAAGPAAARTGPVTGEGAEGNEGATGTPELELPAVPGLTVGTWQQDGADVVPGRTATVPTTEPGEVAPGTAGADLSSTSAVALTAQVAADGSLTEPARADQAPAGRAPAGPPSAPDAAAEPAPAPRLVDALPAAPAAEPLAPATGAPGTDPRPAPGGAPAAAVVTEPAPAAAVPAPAGATAATAPRGALEQPRPAAEAPTLAVEGAVRVDQPARADGVTRTEQPAAPAPAAPPQQPLGTQLASALSRLRTAPEGHHTLHVRVDPEDLGPVKVSAHIGADGVRIELHGMTDAAKDALRGALHDLRRELAATGLRAELDLGSGNDQRGAAERPAPARDGERPTTTAAPAPTPTTPARHGGLDLLA